MRPRSLEPLPSDPRDGGASGVRRENQPLVLDHPLGQFEYLPTRHRLRISVGREGLCTRDEQVVGEPSREAKSTWS